MDNRLKVGDWLLLDEDNMLCRVDSRLSNKPLVYDLQMFLSEDGEFTWQSIRPEQHKITKITKEVADIMRGV